MGRDPPRQRRFLSASEAGWTNGLFTGVRGRGILRSSASPSPITPSYKLRLLLAGQQTGDLTRRPDPVDGGPPGDQPRYGGEGKVLVGALRLGVPP